MHSSLNFIVAAVFRIFKVSSDFFAVIGPITESPKMLEICHGKYNFWSNPMGVRSIETFSAKKQF